MPRFSKKRMRTRRTRRRGKTRKTRGTGRRSRRGGEGEREAITDNKAALDDAAWALTKSRNPENVPSSVWNKYPENPFITENDNIRKQYSRLGPVKGGSKRITRRKTQKRRRR